MTSNLRHLAVIMDGNNRWAKAKNVSEATAYKSGANAAKNLILNAIEFKIKYLTLFAFSLENWDRPKYEINIVINLLSYYLIYELNFFHEHNVKIQIIGELAKLKPVLQQKIHKAIKLTENNTALNLYIAFSYSGQYEIVQTCRKIIRNNISPENITIESFSSFLYAKDMPDIDLLIRTGKEKRISNFILWHLAYTEFLFIDKYWPDFDKQDLINGINDFHTRKRNFGKRITNNDNL